MGLVRWGWARLHHCAANECLDLYISVPCFWQVWVGKRARATGSGGPWSLDPPRRALLLYCTTPFLDEWTPGADAASWKRCGSDCQLPVLHFRPMIGPCSPFELGLAVEKPGRASKIRSSGLPTHFSLASASSAKTKPTSFAFPLRLASFFFPPTSLVG